MQCTLIADRSQQNLGVRQPVIHRGRSTMTRALLAPLLLAVVSACARPNTIERRTVSVNSGGGIVTAEGCPSQRPAFWPHSQFRVFFGSPDTTLEAQTGALVFEVRVDSMPGVPSAQISLRNQTIRRDMPYGDSVVRVNAPAGRYYFHARRIGAETVQDSIDVRTGFLDTVKIFLGREMFCSVKAGTE